MFKKICYTKKKTNTYYNWIDESKECANCEFKNNNNCNHEKMRRIFTKGIIKDKCILKNKGEENE